MNIGIFGGSFDPVHYGHLAVAEGALRECGLDEVWLMVSPQNPLKKGTIHASENDRLAMVRMAVEELPERIRQRIKVSDFEFGLPRPSYTVDTLRALSGSFPDCNFQWIAGGDSLAGINRWKEPDIILRDFGLIVYPRPGVVLPNPIPEGVKLLNEVEEFPYSSTQIRAKLNEPGSLESLPVPESVKEYISSRPNLYGA